MSITDTKRSFDISFLQSKNTKKPGRLFQCLKSINHNKNFASIVDLKSIQNKRLVSGHDRPKISYLSIFFVVLRHTRLD